MESAMHMKSLLIPVILLPEPQQKQKKLDGKVHSTIGIQDPSLSCLFDEPRSHPAEEAIICEKGSSLAAAMFTIVKVEVLSTDQLES